MDRLAALRAPAWKGDKSIPLKICIVYAAVASLWIVIEHTILGGGAIYKDLFFIFSTTWLLYILVVHGTRKIHRSEAALRESEGHLKSILETNPCGIILVDHQGILRYANFAAADILGLRQEIMMGQPYDESRWSLMNSDGSAVSPGDLPGARVLRGGETLTDMEYSVKRPDGERLILSVNSAPLVSEDGGIVGMVASFFDISDRRRAETLHLQKLYLAAQQTPTTVMITDTDWIIEYVNPSHARMTGYSVEEVIGTRHTAVCEGSPDLSREIASAVGGAGRWTKVCRNARKNGEPYWESISVTPIRDQDGNVNHYLWVREDITEKRLAEEALKENQERYRDLVESISDCVWEVAPDLSLKYVSPKIRDQLGYEPEEVIGKTPFDLMPAFEVERLSGFLHRIISEHLPFERVEAIALHKDGRYIVLETNGLPVHSPQGDFQGWRMVSRDISERKRSEEALRESEERFRMIFEQNEEPVIIFRPGSTQVLDANPAAASIFGFTIEELKQVGPALFLTPDCRDEFEGWIRGIGEDSPLSVDQTSHRRKDGTNILVSIRGKTIRLKEGVVSYCTFRDITARIRAEEEAKSKQAQLIHANRMASLGTMVSGVAHEINNPTNLIMFNSPMLRSAWSDAEKILVRHFEEGGDFPVGGIPFSEMRGIVPRLFEGISEASQRIKNIVGNLKDFSRQDKSRLDCVIDVNEVVKAAVGIINHQIIKGTRNFRVEYGAPPPKVRGCAQQLEQVVINLVLNSLDALPDIGSGVRVATSTNRESGVVEILVEDEGSGMSREVMERVTEPFFSTKLETGGLGLGLSLSFSIIREHKGGMIFESKVGKGTTVRVTLPAIDDTMEASQQVSIPKYS